MGDPQFPGQHFGLGSLAGSWRSHQYHPHALASITTNLI
jgi:hypothetical protein